MISNISARALLNREVAKGWHRVFLWAPKMMVTGEERWLEFAERQAVPRPNIHVTCFEYEYRALTTGANRE